MFVIGVVKVTIGEDWKKERRGRHFFLEDRMEGCEMLLL